ncbi:alcohol dehydrogenase catalytic domain-containing protein [Spirosoma rhododendri]|uniref:Alcohol dehydrogenase catalytic domain-containing protein n=2 Tax=Spirosoma rhododendri TaxID=2728024 RepID=A0A7L5DVA2_9BACT|nr:alcohol dehydrogenase catalytic domain-containing protein [Spirosoma rhododendri]
MNAFFLEKPQQLSARNIPVPEPGRGEVRVKLAQVGVCGSDVHVFLGHRPLSRPTVIGHEGYGFIDKLGAAVTNRTIGERVVIEPNIPCMNCRFCFTGKGHICPNKRVIGLTENGCFAEYVCLPSAFCWAIPDEIDAANAVCIEPTAVSVHALFLSSARPGDTIAVVGLGAIGLLLTHLALRLGYRVLVSEISESKLQKAVNEGAIAAQGDAPTLNAIWEAHEVAAVFECAGSAGAVSLVAGAAPRGSEIVLLGLSEKHAQFTPLKIAREGITIVPSLIYQHPTDFRRTIELIRRQQITPATIISGYYPLNDIQAAFERAATGEESKLIIDLTA